MESTVLTPSEQDSLTVEGTLLGDHFEIYDSKFKDEPLNPIAFGYIELLVESARIHDVIVGMLVHLEKSKNVFNETVETRLLRIF